MTCDRSVVFSEYSGFLHFNWRHYTLGCVYCCVYVIYTYIIKIGAKRAQRVKILYVVENLIEGYMMYNEDIRSTNVIYHNIRNILLFLKQNSKKVKHATPRNKWSECWSSSSITYSSPLEGHYFSRSSAYQWVRIVPLY